MASTWGTNRWGDNSWQSDNNIIDLSGANLNTSIGTFIATPATGWGAGPYGFNEWNELSDTTPPITGVAINTTSASVTVTAEINEGWGAFTWGYTTWGSVGDAFATGQEVASTLANVNITTSVTQGWGRNAYGLQVWGDSDEAAAPTGIQLSSTLATVSINAEVNEGWGRLTWSEEAWGIGGDVLASGQQINSTLASVTIDAEINIGWGRLTWGQNDWGTSTLSVSITATAESLTSSLGTSEGQSGADVQLSTYSNPGWGSTIGWGDQLWGTAVVNMFMSTAEGTVDPEPDAEATGQQLNTTVANLSITGTATVDVTGILLNMSEGDADLDANTLVDVTGVLVGTVEVNSAVAGAGSEALLTGIALTPTIGNITLNVWTEIDPNQTAVWTEIAA